MQPTTTKAAKKNIQSRSLISLLVEGTGVGGGVRNVGVTGSLVGAGGELELVGSLKVGVAGGALGGA